MALAGHVSAKFTADVGQYVEAMEKVNKANRKGGESVDSLGKTLKKSLGEDSGVGLLGKTLMGAGAVAGLSVVASAASNGAAKLVELRDAYDAGKLSAGELVEEVAKSIPVFGRVWEAGRNIRELITGEQAAANAMKEWAEQTDRVSEAMRALGADRKQWAAEAEKAARVVPDAIARANAHPFEGVFDAAKELSDKLEEIEKGRVAKLSTGAIADWTKELEKLSAQRDQMVTAMGGVPGPREEFKTDSNDEDRIKQIENFRHLEDQISTLRSQIRKSEDDANGWARSMGDSARAGAVLKGVAEGITGALRDLGTSARNPTSGLGGLIATAENKAQPVLAFMEKWVDYFRQLRESVPSVVGDTMKPFDQYQKTLADLGYLQRVGAISADTAGRAGAKAFWKGWDEVFSGPNHLLDPARGPLAKLELMVMPIRRFFAEYEERTKAVGDAQTTVTQAMLDRLNAGAALGNEESRQAAARLRVEEEIRQKREALLKVATNNRLPADARAAAEAELNRLPELQAALLKAGLNGGQGFQAVYAAPQLSANFSTNSPNLAASLLAESQKQTEYQSQIAASAKKQPGVVNIGGN